MLRGLHDDTRFDVLVAGVGSVAAAVNTAKALAAKNTVWLLVQGSVGVSW